MAQQVQSIPDSNFTVSPLTTVAGTIVSRRRVKIPVNQPTTYTHIKGNQISQAIFDIADNECFVDLQKLVFVADIRLTWPPNWPAPSLDGSTQSFFFKISIGSAQGLKIEELTEYSLMSSMMLPFTESALHREHNLLEYTDYNSNYNKPKSGCNFYDGSDSYLASGQFVPNRWNRMHIRIHHSSFLSRARFLPLFLFRNGLRFEIDFEDVQKVFVINNAPSLDSMRRYNQYLPQTITAGPQNIKAFYLMTMGANAPAYSYTSANTNVRANGVIDFSHQLVVAPHIYNTIMDQLTGRILAPHADKAGTTYLPFYIYKMKDGVSKLVYAGVMSFLPQGAGSGFSLDGAHIAADGSITDAAYTNVRLITVATNSTALGVGNAGIASRAALAAANFNTTFPYGVFPATSVMPNFITAARGVTQKIANQYTSESTDVEEILALDFANVFATYDNGVPTNFSNLSVHPGVALMFGCTTAQQTSITYELKNLELLMDLVKPAADDFLKYQQAFQSGSGIPYQYKRALFRTRTIDYTASGTTQIPLDISVRSLTGLLITLQDPLSGTPAQDANAAYIYPHLTSFLRRGLQRAEVVVGGQLYPIYPLLFRRSGDGDQNNWNDAHILEAENLFGVIGTGGFTPAFSKLEYDTVRNYMFCSHNGKTDAEMRALENTIGQNASITDFQDSSKFILALSMAKDDVVQFATGIDTSQSGQISVNLYWSTYDPFQQLATRIKVNIFAFCDAVFTLQNDANLVRY
jgi:hypothetical protein